MRPALEYYLRGDPVEAWANKVASLGGTVSVARFEVVRQFVGLLKTPGIWPLIDQLNPWWAENAAQASVCLVSQRVATLVNGPTFEANRGYTGDGVSSYINTNFIANTHKRAVTGGNLHIGAQVLTNVAGAISVMGAAGGGTATRMRPLGSTTIGAQMLAALSSFPNVVATSVGYTAIQRAGTTTMKGRRDDTALTDVVVTAPSASLPTGATFVLARNNSGSPAEFYTGQVGLTYECAPLTDAQWATMREAIRTFGQAVGAI